MKETVQDVTNDYIDSESTLTNLRAEQQRLLGFMNQTQNVNDAVNIEQQLAQVEGQINDIEAHLNALKGQTTFYAVTVTIQPVGSAPPPPAPSESLERRTDLARSMVRGCRQYGRYSYPSWSGCSPLASISYPPVSCFWLIRKRPWKSRILPQVSPAGAFSGTRGPLVASPDPIGSSDTATGDADPE